MVNTPALDEYTTIDGETITIDRGELARERHQLAPTGIRMWSDHGARGGQLGRVALVPCRTCNARHLVTVTSYAPAPSKFGSEIGSEPRRPASRRRVRK